MKTRGPESSSRLSVVFHPGEDREGAVDLLEQYDAHQPVGKGHRREGQTPRAGRFHLLVKAVGASDDEIYLRSAFLGGCADHFREARRIGRFSLDAEGYAAGPGAHAADELTAWLRQAGFSRIDLFGDQVYTDPAPDALRWHLVAHKGDCI